MWITTPSGAPRQTPISGEDTGNARLLKKKAPNGDIALPRMARSLKGLMQTHAPKSLQVSANLLPAGVGRRQGSAVIHFHLTSPLTVDDTQITWTLPISKSPLFPHVSFCLFGFRFAPIPSGPPPSSVFNQKSVSATLTIRMACPPAPASYCLWLVL